MLVVLIVAALAHAPGRFLGALLAALASLGPGDDGGTRRRDGIVDRSRSCRSGSSCRSVGLACPCISPRCGSRWATSGGAPHLQAFIAVAAIVLVLAAVEAANRSQRGCPTTLVARREARRARLSPGARAAGGLPRVQSVFQHPLQLGAYLVALIPLVAVLRRHATALWERGFYAACCCSGCSRWCSRVSWRVAALLLALLLVGRRGVGRWLLFAVGGSAGVVVMWQLGCCSELAGVRGWLISGVLHALLAHYGFGTGPERSLAPSPCW